MKALVLTGGANQLSKQAGLVHDLVKNEDRKYDIIVGTSAGAIVGPALAGGVFFSKMLPIMEMLTIKDVFDFFPFKIKGDLDNAPWEAEASINYWKVLRRIIRRKRTWGSTRPLLDIIQMGFDEDAFKHAWITCRHVIVTTCSIQDNKLNYFEVRKGSNWSQFTHAMWASTSFPMFMSNVDIDGKTHFDGGVREHMPLSKAVSLGATEIDIVSTRRTKKPFRSKNSFDTLYSVMNNALEETANNDLKMGTVNAFDKPIKFRLFEMESDSAPLIFHPKLHERFFTMGQLAYAEGKDNWRGVAPHCKFNEGMLRD